MHPLPKWIIMLVLAVWLLSATAGVALAAFQAGDQAVIEAVLNASCRSGPGAAFERTGFLLKGQQVRPLGVDSAGSWFYIPPPRGVGSNCWVASSSVRVVEGDVKQLAPVEDTIAAETGQAVMRIFVIPGQTGAASAASPTPAVTGSSGGAQLASPAVGTVDGVVLTSCGELTMAYFGVRNRGAYAYESARLTVRDLSTGRYLYGPASSNAPFFLASQGCQAGFSRLAPDKAAYVGGALPGLPTRGHQIQATIRLCSQDDGAGACVERVVDFIAP